jgi:hypothetical protein
MFIFVPKTVEQTLQLAIRRECESWTKGVLRGLLRCPTKPLEPTEVAPWPSAELATRQDGDRGRPESYLRKHLRPISNASERSASS